MSTSPHIKEVTNMTKTKKIVLSGLFMAIGVILPQITGHLAGPEGGRMFLPMHIPVLLAGMLCGPLCGGLVGLITPTLSSLVTGGMMPMVYPMLPIMCAELFTYGLVGGICVQKLRWNAIFSLLTAMVAGRVAYGLMFGALFLNHGEGPFMALGVWGAVVAGIPGIIIQLILLPQILFALRRYGNLENEKCPAAKSAKYLITAGKATCIAIKDGEIAYQESGRGVAPLIDLYENKKEVLAGAYVLDKVIGKAAAMILVLGGAKKVYGERMSQSAIDYLKAHHVKCAYGEKLGMILNLAGTGICPLENSVLNIEDPLEGYNKLAETLGALRGEAV
jgi:riboflavin transporter FmnP